MDGSMYINSSVGIFAFDSYKYKIKVIHSLKMLKCHTIS